MQLQSILDQIVLYLPRVLAAVVLLLLAWIIAKIARGVVVRLMRAAHIDERVQRSTQPVAAGPATPVGTRAGAKTATGSSTTPVALAETLGNIVYWLVILAFLPAILGTLGMVGLLEPVSAMVGRILEFLPNLLGAALILLIGWLVARVLQQLLTNILIAAGIDRLSERVGMANTLSPRRLSDILGMVVFTLILIPALISALNTLGLTAISQPLSNMLNQILAALPNIFAALVLLVIAYIIARLIASLVSNLLAGLGFDAILSRLGFKQPAAMRRSPSDIVGWLAMAAIMLFAAIEALHLVGFAGLSALLTQFMVLAGQVLTGLIILTLGLYLANFAGRAIRDSGTQNAALLARVARIAILVLSSAMALRQMGFAPEIINLAFGFLVGGLAIAIALAFGLGGQQTAAQLTREWVQAVRTPDVQEDLPPGTPQSRIPPQSAQ